MMTTRATMTTNRAASPRSARSRSHLLQSADCSPFSSWQRAGPRAGRPYGAGLAQASHPGDRTWPVGPALETTSGAADAPSAELQAIQDEPMRLLCLQNLPLVPGQDKALGSFVHFPPIRELAQARQALDSSYNEEMARGFLVVGPIPRSGR